MGRPRQKVILFIVEGFTDQDALERPIMKMLENNPEEIKAEFLVAEEDITSHEKHNPTNILEKINKFYFEPFFSANYYYYPKDIIEVVQICDLDGAFIPEENCRQFTETIWTYSGFYYDPPYIYGPTSEKVISRNRRKAENLDYLRKQDTIKVISKTVPYSIYFFSMNLEHYCHNCYNRSGKEKRDLAKSFADENEKDLDQFYQTFSNSTYSLAGMSLQDSWDYIKENGQSLERYSNFGIYIMKLKRILDSSHSSSI